MTRADAGGQAWPLRSEMMRLTLRQFLDLVTTSRVAPAGPPGGDEWSLHQRCDLWHSLESGWPIGTLTAWRPHNIGRYHLLDGHRRMATILQTTTHAAHALLRDLTSRAPTYRGAAHDAGCLPTTAMFSTVNFLAAATPLPGDLRRHAEQVANRVHHASVDILALSGGTPSQLYTLCGRLLGPRVTEATLTTLARIRD